MRRLSKRQKCAAAAEDTQAWVLETQRLRPHIPAVLWALWPAVVSHNVELLASSDFAAATEIREAWLFALAYVGDVEAAAAVVGEEE